MSGALYHLRVHATSPHNDILVCCQKNNTLSPLESLLNEGQTLDSNNNPCGFVGDGRKISYVALITGINTGSCTPCCIGLG